MSELIYLPIALLLATAVYTDLRSRTIPNWLVLGVLVLSAINVGLSPENAQAYALSFVIGIVIWGALFYSKLMGGGDAKLMMALSLLVLPASLFNLYLCVFIIGALQALWWKFYYKDSYLPYAVAIFVGYVLWLGQNFI